jgi:hypothetical protein
MNRTSILPVLLLVLAACGTQPAAQHEETPAFIPEPTAESQKIISEAVAALKNGAQIQIGNNAFAATDTLIVHRSQLTGRDLGIVDRFQLVIRDGQCGLIYANSDNRVELPDLNCSPYMLERDDS